jgi:broad specificity phosphatase PhoE
VKTLEVRRHSYAKSDRSSGSYLSVRGVSLARAIGAKTGPFDSVFASTIARTSETAIAMGFAVDDVIDIGLDDGFWSEVGRHDHWSMSDPWASYAEAITDKGHVARVAKAQRDAWLMALEAVPDGGSVLFVSHGHAIEVGLVACFDDRNLHEIGPPFRQLEGFRAPYGDGTFGDLQIMRVSEVGE